MEEPNIAFRVSETMDGVVALVLGGGRGTRLYPLTLERAKPAVPLGGRYRLVDIPLSNCLNSDVFRIFVLTQFNSTSLNRHITRSYTFEPFSKGFVEVLAAEQTVESGDWYQGTADAIRKHLKHIKNQRASHYLILAGDHLYRMDYRSFLATHLRCSADITVAVLPVDKRRASSFGILQVQPDARIVHFVEKPEGDALKGLETPRDLLARYAHSLRRGQRYLASMGIYVFRAEVLEEFLAKQTDCTDFGKHVIPKSLSQYRVFAHPFTGFWEDIGTVRSYYEASLRLVKPSPPFDFNDPNFTIYSRPRYLPGSRIEDARIRDSIVCEGSHISKATISNSIIGIRTIIQPGSRISKSILMGADYFENEHIGNDMPIGIGPGSRVTRAIIDKNARIGSSVVIQGTPETEDHDGDGWVVRDGIVIVLKNAVVPDGTDIH
jgi:glucose-1-phosphate adenylyltransferase